MAVAICAAGPAIARFCDVEIEVGLIEAEEVAGPAATEDGGCALMIEADGRAGIKRSGGEFELITMGDVGSCAALLAIPRRARLAADAATIAGCARGAIKVVVEICGG